MIFTIGAKGSEQRIRDGLARGADRAVRIDDPALANADSLGIGRALAAALKAEDVSLVLCGKQGVDGDNSQVPAIIAETLGCAQISVVSHLEATADSVTAHRSMGGGNTHVVTASLPAVVTADKGLNTPRFASLPGIMKAKRKKIAVKSAGDLGLDAGALAPVVVESSYSLPPARPAGRILDGADNAAKVAELVRLLREEAKVI